MKNSTDKPKRKKVARRNSWAGETAVVGPSTSCQSTKSSTSTISTTSSSGSLPRKLASRIQSANLHSFVKRYQELCEYYQAPPLAAVKAHLTQKVLDFSADRIKTKDWKPILEALLTDQELHSITLRSRYPQKVVKSANTYEKVSDTMKNPVLFTHFFLNGLIVSLNGCLSGSNSLTCLELVGMPLLPKYLSHLLEGISNTKILQHLSLESCPLGDEGTEELCKSLSTLPRIVTLNLSNCGLSPVGACYIASLIKAQKMQRFLETWQKSLRYQNPNLDTMWGIRRIIINSNSQLGDEGVKVLADILEDDLWVKAIDMQKCGIGKEGAMELLTLLRYNCVIAIIDVRNNRNIPAGLLKEVMYLLRENNRERIPEYHWIDLRTPSHSSLSWMSSLSQIQQNVRRNVQSTNELKSSSPSTVQTHGTGYKSYERPQSQPIKRYAHKRYQF